MHTGCARRAVATYHRDGASAARRYLEGSKVGEWATRENPGMRSANQAVLDGFDWYCATDRAVGLTARAMDVGVDISLPSGPLHVRLDVVLGGDDVLAARAILWDGPAFAPEHEATLAYPFAVAMTQTYPDATITGIGVWQARRQQLAEIPISEALARAGVAARILRAM